MPWVPFFLTPGKAYTIHTNTTRIHAARLGRMSAPALTIRNFTPTPFVLKLVERFEGSHSAIDGAREALSEPCEGAGGFLKNATSALGLNSTVSAAAELVQGFKAIPPDAQPFGFQDVDIRVGPFSTQRTEISTAERGPHDVLRLTLEAGGQRYRTDIPGPKNESQPLLPIDGDNGPKLSVTAVYLPEQSYLALFSSDNLQAWMRELKDGTPLSALSLPGTHNSPTHHRALPSVRCQAVSPREQLANGVRFFDVRVQPEDPAGSDKLILVHSVFPISVTGSKYFREELLSQVFEFLDANPSETLVMSVKREGTGNATDQQLSTILYDHYTSKEPHRWYTDPRIPSLGAARGKIVLMRRFGVDGVVRDAGMRDHGDHGDVGPWAIDASTWADNTAFDQQTSIAVQDFYEVLETENIEKKLQVAQDMLVRAAGNVAKLPGINTDKDYPEPAGPFFVNFLTASNFWKVGCWPERIAAKLNPGIVRFLCQEFGGAVERGEAEGDAQTGIVVTDWCGADGDWDLIRCIVGMNARLMAKERQM